MKYTEQLKIAKKEKLNITKLFIAYEVESLLRDLKKEVDEEIYENLCSIVYENYLKIDYSSINDVARIVCGLFINSQEIGEEIIRDKLENMYL